MLMTSVAWRCLRVERAMGIDIEPTRTAPLGLENKQLGAMANCMGHSEHRGGLR
jgi:hypothetical protein